MRFSVDASAGGVFAEKPPAGPPFFDRVCAHYGKLAQGLPPLVVTQLRNFVQWAQNDGLRWCLLREPVLSVRWITAVLACFQAQHNPCPQTLQFLTILHAHKRLARLPEILSYVEFHAYPGKTIYLRTAKKLDDQDVHALTQRLMEKHGVPVRLHQNVNPDLLAGGIVLWDCWMMDASLRSLFNHLEKEMIYAFD